MSSWWERRGSSSRGCPGWRTSATGTARTSGRTRTTTPGWRSAPPDSINGTPIPKTLYIPDLADRLAQIGSGSSYVITELDGAYTKFYEVTFEAEWRSSKTYARASYSHNHYWGNFDQDNSTSGNDANIFIGSSNIGDGAGRQLWNFKDGTLRGDRPHLFKLFGYYQLGWNATVGAYFFAQSGQPWEKWSYEPYIALTTSTSDSNRYAEPAGSRRSARALAARPQLHAEPAVQDAVQGPARGRPVQRLQQPDRVQLRPCGAQFDVRRAPVVLRAEAHPAGHAFPVLKPDSLSHSRLEPDSGSRVTEDPGRA